MCKVYDITNLSSNLPKNTSFAMDTHILLWTFYIRCAITKAYQKIAYPEFIKSVISNGNRLVVTTLNINEMFHFIEKNECDIYNNLNSKNLTVKKFRQIEQQRELIQKEIQLILRQLSNIPCITIEPSVVNPSTIDTFTEEFSIHSCDFFDFYLIDYCNRNKISIITDDVDFLNGFTKTDLYTANPQALLKSQSWITSQTEKSI